MKTGKLLENKRVLITGGSRGLGRSFCEYFSLNGADVAFNYSSDNRGAEETLALIHKSGRKGLAYQAPVTDSNAIQKMVQQIEKEWQEIDILINNAGISQPLPLPLMDENDWDQVFSVNVKGQFIVAQTVLRGMIRRKQGVLLNIGSLAGLRLIEAPIHYSASKAAIHGFTQALAKEVARYQIRVNCLAPGLLEKGVGQNLPEHRLKEYLKYCALHRVGKMEEVAKFAAFLVSDKNTYMNGETILMDGGF